MCATRIRSFAYVMPGNILCFSPSFSKMFLGVLILTAKSLVAFFQVLIHMYSMSRAGAWHTRTARHASRLSGGAQKKRHRNAKNGPVSSAHVDENDVLGKCIYETYTLPLTAYPEIEKFNRRSTFFWVFLGNA